MKAKSHGEVLFKTDFDKIYPGRNMCIKAMKEIAPIFRKEFLRFDKNFDFSLLSDKRLFEIFLEKLSGISNKYKDRNFTVQYDEEKERFYTRVVLYDNYPGDTVYAIPISVLPDLFNIDKELHDFFIRTLSVLAENGVDVIYSSYWGEMEYDQITDILDEEKDNSELKNELELFHEYADRYRYLLGEKSYSKNKCLKMLDYSRVNKKIRKKALRWLDLIDQVSSCPISLNEVVESAREAYADSYEIDIDDIYDNGNPVEIDMVFRITWFCNSSYTDSLCSTLGEIQGNFGEIFPNTVVNCFDISDFNNARKRHDENYYGLPELIIKTFNLGVSLFDDIYKYVEKEKNRKWKQDKENINLKQLSLSTQET